MRSDQLKEVVDSTKGWEWTDEGGGKWGYVATEVGARIVLKLPARCSAGFFPRPQIGFLGSYEHMGVVQATCVPASDCTCAPATMNAHTPNDRTSQDRWWELRIAADGGSGENCRVALTVDSNTTSGGHKWKLTAVMFRCTMDG